MCGYDPRDVTVVICAKNEERTISDVIVEASRYADRVLVVDGQSTDGTSAIAQAAGADVIQDRGKGKGDAIRCAIPHVESLFTIFLDADGSHDPDDIPRLLQPLQAGKADHVSGSRLLGGSSELHGGFDECFRLMGSSFITACINWRFKVRLSESQNGFRAIRTDVLRQLDLREDITTIEQEMIMKTLRRGFQMAEVPAHEHCRKAGKSSIRVSRVAFRYVWTVVKYLFIDIKANP